MMTHKFRFIFVFIFIWLCISCDSKTDTIDIPPSETVRPLVLISLDGFRWDYLDRNITPNLNELATLGAKAEGLTPPFPSKTFPSHLTIITGSYPNNHGIISNKMYDPVFDEFYTIGSNSNSVSEGKWYDREPLWVTVEKNNLKAMTMFWPGSEAEIMGYRPSQWFAYDHSISNEKRVNQVLTWIDLPPQQRPVSITTYFSDVDAMGHTYGPNSDEVNQAIQKVDNDIGKFVSGLKERKIFNDIDIVIVSDHGMTEISSDRIIFLDEYINTDHIEPVGTGAITSLNFADGLSEIEQVEIYNTLTNAHPQMNVFLKGNFPEEYHMTDNRRITDITIMANSGWLVIPYDGYYSYYQKGNHGYNPRSKDMLGIFIGHGPAFKNSFLGPKLETIHLYEMFCKILNIPPAINDGDLSKSAIYLN